MSEIYHIKLKDGLLVPVSEEVYRAYKRPQWREMKRIKKKKQLATISFDDRIKRKTSGGGFFPLVSVGYIFALFSSSIRSFACSPLALIYFIFSSFVMFLVLS